MVRTTPQTIFAMQMEIIRKNAPTTEPFVSDDRADRELVSFTQKAMREKLAQARHKGKSGWWKQNECSVEHLHERMIEAVQEDNMINVINYAAMIHARRVADE